MTAYAPMNFELRRMRSINGVIGVIGALAMAIQMFAGGPAGAQVIQLERPGDRQFVLDKADLITPEDEEAIRRTADALLTETAVPIVVVTIESMSAHLGPGRELPWETFARVLFDEWGIGHLTVGNPPNTGILLLVSRDDRKARIELGTGWTIERDAEVQSIMQSEIIPQFKRGDFSEGIAAGVIALEQMARRPAGTAAAGSSAARSSGGSGRSSAPFSLPGRSGGSGLSPMLGCGAVGLVVALVVILIVARSMSGGLTRGSINRSRGWYGGFYPGAWYGLGSGSNWGRSFGGRSFSSGGGFSSGGFSGGFSGGSFGGGFSGGRGASGSW